MVENNKQAGYTLVELMITTLVITILFIGIFSLLSGMVFSSVFIKRQATAMTLATNKMEYYKSLPYDSLAIEGGSIAHDNPLPSTDYQTINGVDYTIVSAMSYVDNAYDGCGSYPSQELKELYCRNYPSPEGSSTDINPKDYKNIAINVYDASGSVLASVDTNVAARVAETSSTTGALFVYVLDNNGNPISGANVNVINNSLSPAINMTDSTDVNGVAIFYDLKPDTTGYDYEITASISGYSSLTTLKPSGSLQPNYPSQNILSQQSSSVTLTIKPQGDYSLVAEAVDTSGNVIPNMQIYMKGGYKKYTSDEDTSYYFDNYTPDTRPLTDSGGMLAFSYLVPGPYIFCGDDGGNNCTSGSTTYYLVAAMPYTGNSPFSPVNMPTYLLSDPPETTYEYNSNHYLQKVRLVFSTASNHPRIYSLSPYEAYISSSPMSNFEFQIIGNNLPCSSNPASCSTSVKFIQAASEFNASCTGSSAGQILNCNVDLSTAVSGNTQLQVSSNGHTFTAPTGMLGGIIVLP
jgi:type II secretory pathway pseudopilin PulG